MICYYYNGSRVVADHSATEQDFRNYKKEFGFCELTRPALIEALEKPVEEAPKKVHFLTEIEIAAQNEWALTQMTAEEVALCKVTKPKPIELEQFEFYLDQEGYMGKERERKLKQFKRKFFKRTERKAYA